MIGSRLANYQITSHIGSGGMGEVYRARDAHLNRDVALKILPERFALDGERLARFKREAQVLASLNHPNIAAIYGFEESGGLQALVLELVEGNTLADRIAQGPVPLDEAMAIARQIAEALEAAHEHGIVHRDLKPANIKVREDGTVKVLDFGLAKAMEPTGAASPAISQSPTITSPAMTQMGVILGTAAYMSPEQAKGRPADKRADIWAFGCVLYEMLTGKRAFEGEDVADTLAFVLTREPDWNALPAATPLAISRLLRRSLEKDRKRRLPDIADARIEIDDAGNDREMVAQPAATDRRMIPSRERIAWAAAVLLAAAMTAAIAIGVSYVRVPPAAPEMRLDIITPGVSESLSFAISPDGRQLVFVASGDGQPRLWLRSLDAETAQPIAGTEGAQYPFWSPDSKSVGFFADAKLKRIDIGSGAPRTLANAGVPNGGAWSPDGVILFSPGSSNPLYRIPATGGDVVAVTKLDPPRQILHSFPEFLPDGHQFLFHVRGAADVQGVYIGSLDSSETTRLVGTDRGPGVYVQPGWLLFIRQGALVAQRFDPSRRTLSGDLVFVADSVALVGQTAAYTPAAVSVSKTGLVGYRTGEIRQTQLTWFDRSGKVLGTLGGGDGNAPYNPELSPDGRQVAVRRVVDNNADIWILNNTRAVRFTVDAGIDQYPVWSPDGNWIAFNSQQKGPSDLYRKRASGAGNQELLWESPVVKNLDDWSPNGRYLLYNAQEVTTGRDLWVLPLEGDRKPLVFLKTNFEEHRGQFSPDGHWITYVSDESGRPEIYVRPFPGPGGQWQVSTSGGIQPRWRPDGKELYYIAPDGQLMAASIAVKDGAIEPGAPMALFQTRISGGGTNTYTRPQYDVAPDGRFLVNRITDADTTTPITLLLNWKPRP